MRLKLKTVKLAHEYECLFGIGLLITIEGFFFFPYKNPMEIKPKIYTHIYAISYRPQYKEISHKFVNPTNM